MTETLIQAEEFTDYVEQLPNDERIVFEKYGFTPLAKRVDLAAVISKLSEDPKLKEMIAAQVELGLPLFAFGFHSVTPEGVDRAYMQKLDEKAWEELGREDGFLAYFPGEPDKETGMAFSWCLWVDFELATKGSKASPAHQKARKLAPKYYESAVVEHHNIHLIDSGKVLTERLMPPQEMECNPVQLGELSHSA